MNVVGGVGKVAEKAKKWDNQTCQSSTGHEHRRMKKEEFHYDAATEEKIRQLFAAGKSYKAIERELGMSEMTMFEYICVISRKDDAVANRNAAKEIRPYASKPRACPSCGDRPVATILYGMPAEGRGTEEKVAAGLITYGGCVKPKNPPRWKCTKCGQMIHSTKPVTSY